MWISVIVLVIVILTGIGVSAWLFFKEKANVVNVWTSPVVVEETRIINTNQYIQQVVPEDIVTEVVRDSTVGLKHDIENSRNTLEMELGDALSVQGRQLKSYMNSEMLGLRSSNIRFAADLKAIDSSVGDLNNNVAGLNATQASMVLKSSNLDSYIARNARVGEELSGLARVQQEQGRMLHDFPLDMDARFRTIGGVMDKQLGDYNEYVMNTGNTVAGMSNSIGNLYHNFDTFSAKITSDLGLYNTSMDKRFLDLGTYADTGFSNVGNRFKMLDANLQGHQDTIYAIQKEASGYGTSVLKAARAYTDQEHVAVVNKMNAVQGSVLDTLNLNMKNENLVLRDYSDQQLSSSKTYTGAQLATMSNAMTQYINNQIVYALSKEESDAKALNAILNQTQDTLRAFTVKLNNDMVDLGRAVATSNAIALSTGKNYTDVQMQPYPALNTGISNKLTVHTARLVDQDSTLAWHKGIIDANQRDMKTSVDSVDSRYTVLNTAVSSAVAGHTGQLQNVTPLIGAVAGQQTQLATHTGYINDVVTTNQNQGNTLTTAATDAATAKNTVATLKQQVGGISCPNAPACPAAVTCPAAAPAAVQLPANLLLQKPGNNGSDSCDTFCRNWVSPTSRCAFATEKTLGSIACSDAVNYSHYNGKLHDVTCFCSYP